jgi:hypothetical protein
MNDLPHRGDDMMFQQVVFLFNLFFRNARTSTRIRRSTYLTVQLLEERATPAVVVAGAAFAPPAIVQVATLSQEAHVRADLFGSGGADAITQNVVEETAAFIPTHIDLAVEDVPHSDVEMLVAEPA